jgi:hypothetical protein
LSPTPAPPPLEKDHLVGKAAGSFPGAPTQDFRPTFIYHGFFLPVVFKDWYEEHGSDP